MNKPFNFKGVIYIENFDILYINSLINQYGFYIENCFLIGEDNIYENLKSRMVFLLRALKKENYVILSYKITCTVFDSTLHGELI